MPFNEYLSAFFPLLWLAGGTAFWMYCRYNDPKLGTLRGWFICQIMVPKVIYYFLESLTHGD